MSASELGFLLGLVFGAFGGMTLGVVIGAAIANGARADEARPRP